MTFAAAAATKATMMGLGGSCLERSHLVDTALRTGPRFLDALGRKNVDTMKEVAVASVLGYEEGARAGCWLPGR